MTPRDQRVIAKACSNCRRKKVRCDLTQPSCRNCTQVYHVDCIYDASLSHRSTQVLLDRLAKAESLLDMLAEEPATLPTILSEWKASRAMHTAVNASGPMLDAQNSHTSPSQTGSAALALNSTDAAAAVMAAPAIVPLPSLRKSDSDAELDEQLRFIRQLPSDLIDHLQYIHWTWQWPLHCFADRDATIQDLARIQSDAPRYASPLLLLTLLAHAARFSNRVVVQTSSSTDSFKMGGIFFARAKQLFYKQIDAPPTLPDIAAIIMMASRQVACGSFTQSWVYAGIAIRMIEDMGIHSLALSIASSADPTRALQDPQTRRAWRLFWSAFTFDKTLAFGLGRRPALSWPGELKTVWLGQSTHDSPPPWPETSQPSSIYDPSGLRIPVMAATDSAERRPQSATPCRTSHYPYETFSQYCMLSALFGEILTLSTHGWEQAEDSVSQIIRLRQRLTEWRYNLPGHIAVNDARQETASRPPNIMALNMVYHVCRILLHSSGQTRPAASAPVHIDNHVKSNPKSARTGDLHDDSLDENVCRAAAIEIHALLETWARSFSYDRMTWLMGCCVYTAAVVNAQDVRHSNIDTAREAAYRLNLATYALGISASFTPGIRKSTSALLEFAERINAEHRDRSHNFSLVSFYRPEKSLDMKRASMNPSPSNAFSEASPKDEPLRGSSTTPVEAPLRPKRKASQSSLGATRKHSSPATKRNVLFNGLDTLDWNLGTVDLDTMFKEVLEAEPVQHAEQMVCGPESPSHTLDDASAAEILDASIGPATQAQPGPSSKASTGPTATPPPRDTECDPILLDNVLGECQWNLDALLNDKDLLEALGNLPLYPRDQQ